MKKEKDPSTTHRTACPSLSLSVFVSSLPQTNKHNKHTYLQNIFGNQAGDVVDMERAEQGVQGEDACVFLHGALVVECPLCVEQNHSNLRTISQLANKRLAPHPDARRLAIRAVSPAEARKMRAVRAQPVFVALFSVVCVCV